MMKIKRFLSIIFIYFSLSFLVAANIPSGIELCDSIYSQIKDFHKNTTLQPLVTGGTNTFPYNITITFPGKNPGANNLIFYFTMEDAYSNIEVIKQLADISRSKETAFDIIILLAYGENQTFFQYEETYFMTIKGSRTFLNNLNTNKNYAAICVNLDSPENTVITGSMGTTSPTWLVKETYNAFKIAQINQNIPALYLSQLYHFHFFAENALSDFLTGSIPSVLLKFKQEDSQKCISVLSQLIDSYSQNLDEDWDRHSLMLSIFGHQFWLTEYSILRIILFSILISILFIAFFSIINNNLKKEAWSKINSCWYTYPMTVLLSLILFYVVKGIFLLFHITAFSVTNPFLLLTVQLSTVFSALTVFYIFEIKINKKYIARSIDYLIIISTFINEAAFTIIDISLFPILLMICLIAILSIIFKNNILHIILFFCMIIPFIPYIQQIFLNSNSQNLKFFLFSSNFIPLFLSVLLSPFFLLYFRILTESFLLFKQKFIFPVIFSFIFISICILSIMGTVFSKKQLNEASTFNLNRKITKIDDDFISVKIDDQKVFEDIIRTITLDLGKIPEVCTVTVTSERNNPVNYSDNEYITGTNNTTRFTIPANPPQYMTFSYGAAKIPGKVTVNAIYKTDTENEYIIRTKIIETGID